MQDLRLRSDSEALALDLFSFDKTLGLPGLVSSRVFRAMDRDGDGWVGLEDLAAGLQALYCESETAAELFFAALDFGEKGYLLPEDVYAFVTALRQDCAYCHDPCFPKLKEDMDSLFNCSAELDLEKLLIALRSAHPLLTALRQALISYFPALFAHLYSQVSTCCSPKKLITATPVQSLVVDERKYFGRVEAEALWLYDTAEARELKRIVLLKGLFMQESETRISLCDGRYIVNVCVETNEEKEEWAERLKTNLSPALRDAYELNSRLGSGATGIVYKATCKATMEPAAVKIIPKSSLSRRSESYIRREIQILSALDHPNIVHFLGVYESNEEIGIVTEYMEEGSLFDWMEKCNFHMEEADAKAVTRDTLAGLQYMHSRGVLHRDIKPENLLIKRVNSVLQAKIADFGLACFIGPNEWCTEPVGTLRFAAPEVLSHLPYREAVDLWSVGVTLYIMLHGTMPFAGKSDEETALAVLRRKLNFRGKSWTAVSADAVAVLSALLVRHPRERARGKEVLASEWLRVLITS